MKKEPRPHKSLPIPLFDKFMPPPSPREGVYDLGSSFYTKKEVIESIAREVSRILNTRSSFKKEVYETLSQDERNKGLPGFFGMPEFPYMDAVSEGHWPVIEELCERAIGFYEPRLHNVNVKVKAFTPQTQCLALELQGEILLQNNQEEVVFSLPLSLVAA